MVVMHHHTKILKLPRRLRRECSLFLLIFLIFLHSQEYFAGGRGGGGSVLIDRILYF